MSHILLFFWSLYFLFISSLFITTYSFIYKKGISNFSVHFFIFSFITLLFSLNKRFFEKIRIFILDFKSLLENRSKIILLFLFFFLFVIFSLVGIFRHYSFGSWGLDIGGMDNALWNLSHGNSFATSIDIQKDVNYLGVHFWPIMFLLSPLYSIWPNILILYFLNSFLLALAILPIYWIARKTLCSKVFAFVFIFLYFINRSTQSLVFSDFYTDVFFVPSVLFTFLFIEENRDIWAGICFITMLLCKENSVFILAAFGCYLILHKRKFLFGAILILASFFWWTVITNYVMPFFLKSDGYWYTRWLPYGKTYQENISAVIRQPVLIFRLFLNSGTLTYYFKIFGPLGFLQFFSPAHYILLFVPIATQVIGGAVHKGMLDATAHYQAHILPFLFIAAIFGTKWLLKFICRKFSRFGYRRIALILILYLIGSSVLFSGKSYGHRISKYINSISEYKYPMIASYLSKIPEDASVIATPSLAPHLSHRKRIYLWNGLQKYRFDTQFVVLYKKLTKDPTEDMDYVLGELSNRKFIPLVNDKITGFYILRKKD